ncbi:hypothetical protein G9A89_021494 [Geosiphon pyriformis]|nr:hypothetical protein G9A89_021494 [Geosiphon pyriformis]
MKATASSTTLKKKAPKGAFHGSAGGFFSQKKKVVLNNIKYSGDERDIFLSKSGSSGSVYFDVKSLSGEDEDVSMSKVNGESLLGSAVTTLKAKRVNTGAGFGFLLGSPNFYMDDKEVVLPSYLSISLEKKWIDPKIIKTSMEVSIKKSFALDINLSAIEDKLAMAKTYMEMATSLAREKGIDVNNNLKKQGMRSDQAVIIKEIPMNTPKDMIITIVSEFGEIKLIRIQLIEMWQKTVVDFHFTSGFGSPSSGISGLNDGLSFALVDNSSLDAHLAFLEQSLKLLTDQVSGIVCKLSNMELVPQALSPSSKVSATFVTAEKNLALDIIVDGLELVLSLPSSASSSVSILSLNSLKVLTTKVGSLKSKLVALKAFVGSVLGINVLAKQEDVVRWHKDSGNMISIITETKLRCNIRPWIMNKFNGVQIFTSGLDKSFLGVGVAIIMNNSLACYVSKVKEIPGCVVSVCFFFKDRTSVSIIGLYAGVFSGVRFSLASEINSFIA